MDELSAGDAKRVDEIKSWLKKGMKVTAVRNKLEELGYNDYHISILLEDATGQKFVPPKPKIIISQRKLKLIGEAVVLLLVVGIVIWLVFVR